MAANEKQLHSESDLTRQGTHRINWQQAGEQTMPSELQALQEQCEQPTQERHPFLGWRQLLQAWRDLRQAHRPS